MGNCPVVESAGQAFPLAIRWLGVAGGLEAGAGGGERGGAGLGRGAGRHLAFLPGVAQIERCADLLAERLPQALVLPLHGQVEPVGSARGDPAAIPSGRRRVVLATSIAETSLTLGGVRIVVDAGLSRRAEFDKAAGVTRLVTVRAEPGIRRAARGPRGAARAGRGLSPVGRSRASRPRSRSIRRRS